MTLVEYNYVGKLIVSNYVAVSINNWLQDISASNYVTSTQLTKTYLAKTSFNQLLIDTAM